MGIFINNSQRKSDFQLISDLLNQIQNSLSDPNITDDVKSIARSALSDLSSNISLQNMRKSVARNYTIQQLEQTLATLQSGRGTFKPDYAPTTRPMREMVLFDPSTPHNPITLEEGTTPDKQKRVKVFATNLWNQLNLYLKYLSNDDYAVEGWNADNTKKIKQWLLDLAVSDTMDDDTLNRKISIMSDIVDSLGNEELINSHDAYFSVFDPNRQKKSDEADPESDVSEGNSEIKANTWTYGGNTYTAAGNFGPIGEYLTNQGYEIGELDGKYYVFENRVPSTTNGWYAVLDPTSDAYQTVYNFAPNGLLYYDSYENAITKLNQELRDLLYNRIRDEHNLKFPVEYYSLLGDFDIIDLSNYMTDSDPSNREVIYYKVPSSYLHGLWIDWDEIFRNRPDWKSKFKYDGDVDYDVHTNSSPTNQYANAHGYVANAEFPTLIATDEELNAFLNQVIYDDGLFGTNPKQSISDVLNKPNVDRRSLEDQLANIVRLILKGESGQEELNNSHRPIINTIDIDDIPNTIFTADEKAAYKTRYGHPVRYDYVLKHMLHKNSNMYKRILKRIMLTADNKTDRQNAYNELIRIKNDNPLTYAKGGILKMKPGGSTPTASEYNPDDFKSLVIQMGAPSITTLPTTYMGDPDESDGKTYATFKDLLADEDVRNPLILRGTALLSDMAAAGASNIVGYGTLAAGGLGLLSTGLEAVADYIDPSVSSKEAWRNAGTNLALTGAGLIPNAKFFTSASKGAKLLGNVFMKALQYGMNAQAIAGSLGIASHAFPRFWEMITSNDWEWTQEDAMLIMHTLNMMINGARAANSKVKMNKVQKQVTDPNQRVVEFTGKDGQVVQVKMTEDQYDSYINAGRKAERGKRDEAALKKAQEIVKSTMGQLAADNISGNTISFSGLAKGWYSRPNYGPASLLDSPGGYVKKLLRLGAEPVLPATLRSDITDTSNLPASVKYVTGHGLSGSKPQTATTPKKRDIVIENGKPVEYQNSNTAKNLNLSIFRGIDFSKPTELHKYPNKQNLPKAVRTVSDDLILNEATTKEILQKFNYTLGTSEKVRGGIVYDNKLYWWKSGGKLDRLNNYLLNK